MRFLRLVAPASVLSLYVLCKRVREKSLYAVYMNRQGIRQETAAEPLRDASRLGAFSLAPQPVWKIWISHGITPTTGNN